MTDPITFLAAAFLVTFTVLMAGVVLTGSMHGGHGVCDGCDRLIEPGRTYCDTCIEAAR